MNDLFPALNAGGVRYLLIGGQARHAAVLHGLGPFHPPRDAENFGRLNALLEAELDLPLLPLGPAGENFVQTYQTRWGVLQFHLGLPGAPRFEEAERAAVVRQTELGQAVKCLSGPHLLAAKQAANRPQDQADIEFLLELQRLGKLT